MKEEKERKRRSMMRRDQTVNRFSWTYFFNMMSFGIVVNMFVVLLSSVKAFNPTEVSLIVAIAPLISIPAMFMWGRIIDRDKRLMKWSRVLHVSHAIVLLLLLAVDEFIPFFVLAMIRNIVFQPTLGVLEEYITNLSVSKGVSYGKIRVTGTIGFALMGLVSPLIIIWFGVEGIMLFAIGIMLITGLIFGKLEEVYIEGEVDGAKKSKKMDWGLLKNKEFMKVLLSIGLMTGASQAAVAYGTQVALLEFECPEAVIGILPLIMTLTEVVILLSIHRLKVKEKPYRLITIAGGLSLIRWWLFMVAKGYGLIIFTVVFHGITAAVGLACVSALFATKVREKERSSAFLIFMMFQMIIVPSTLNLICGALIQYFGVTGIGLVYLITVSIGCIIAIVCMRREKEEVLNTVKMQSI